MCIRDRVEREAAPAGSKAPPLGIAAALGAPPPAPVVALRRRGPAEDYCFFLERLVKKQRPS
eukprot:7940749-Alexandrium_andersonii.AAC.1